MVIVIQPSAIDNISRLAGRAWNGAADGWVHYFGKYDEQTARQSVLDSLPNQRCTYCHEPEDVEKNRNHKPWLAGFDPDKKYCTDCHGMHRLDTRVRKWDKKTRKLIWKDGHDVDPNAEPETKPAEERM